MKRDIQIAERVLETVLETAELLIHVTDAGKIGRPDSVVLRFVAADMVAAPIVTFAIETEAFRDKAVAKGAGG
jgi:hypothetical protein